MPLNYDPKDAESAWPVVDASGKPLDFIAVLQNVEDKTSKVKPDGSGGNPMQVLTWEVYHSDGRTQVIEDYITRAGLFKLKQLARALGKEDEFKAGEFQADDHVGCTVLAELNIEQSAGYDDKNKIGKLKMKPDAGNGRPPQQRQTMRPQPSGVGAEVLGNEQQFKDDDIPF